ncbi:MAG TPA: DUF134 domain-containing protein [Fastidiosipila sp.]|nr:DUF134 domain-containing protein [Eubacteriales bacterium]MDD3611646.1 DUF134 domain-containing protein [Eubacteriales bacterium]HHU04251.1 DUF134 domain-containing protein [Fastidiosipila sp.]
MPRPMKRRRVCCLPDNVNFGPLGMPQAESNQVRMTVDEYETVRLIDLEGFTQEECAEQMNVGRTTVQAIYADARKKLADALVNGKLLTIDGGKYQLCDDSDDFCGPACRRRGSQGYGRGRGRGRGQGQCRGQGRRLNQREEH